MSEYKNVPFVPCNDCANFESCTNDFVADLLEPYDVESIEDLIANVRNKTIDDVWKIVLEHQTYQESYLSPPEVDTGLDLADLQKLLSDMKGGAENET